MYILGVGGGSAEVAERMPSFSAEGESWPFSLPPSLPLPPSLRRCYILYSAYPAFIEW